RPRRCWRGAAASRRATSNGCAAGARSASSTSITTRGSRRHPPRRSTLPILPRSISPPRPPRGRRRRPGASPPRIHTTWPRSATRGPTRTISSGRAGYSRSRAPWPSAAAALLLACAAAGLLPLVHVLQAAPLALRALAGGLLAAPLAFALGMPFALGLRRIAPDGGAPAAWAWAVNGFASVVA